MKDKKHPIRQAVALRYSPDQMQAPILAAKGKGVVADEIISKAKEYGIPIQEDPSLVEVLGQLELEREIPPELYQLVAEILSFVYRADNRANSGYKLP
ncbi:EscU/YscU/HrcU family type III secretion system export apparatus switch protein [Gorillibacterium massiliense]|uniref:EscU/YscU/HrcU family type III secretion system export apparatus switch protein n=1 Tax=Gorillibacterium massiliense TaxID=1280390 RepID=UPI0004BC967B|nr:EscU/YscU/HrcU family type III secretion system export apparatus switch protein [Gorillibacterium massiliense]